MTDPTPARQSFSTIMQREAGLSRTLGAGRLSMIAIGGAIGTGLFLGSGFAISTAGPAVLISYLIGAVIALLLMGCLSEMTLAHPTTGSFGAYAEYYLGPWAGFLVRYAYWMCIVLAVGTEVSAVALYMQYWFPTVPGWCWIVGFSTVLIAINAISVGAFASVEYVFSLIKIVAIAAFVLLGGAMIATSHDASLGFHNYVSHGGFMPHGVWGVWVAVIIAIFSYLSIEMIAVAAGEAAEPQVAVRRAFRSTVVRLVLFYLLSLSIMLAVLPWTQAGSGRSPFVLVMQALHLPAAGDIMNFVILVAALSAMNSQLYIATRMMFSLARASHAPPLFGRLTRSGVPRHALLVSTSGMALATLLNAVSPAAAFLTMLSISVFGAMFTWMMIFITHYFFRRARNRSPAIIDPAPGLRMWGYPYTSLLGAALMGALLLTTPFTTPFRLTLLWGLPVLLLMALVFRMRYRRNSSPPGGT
jgi:L-asparagine transporter-like permease